MFVSVRCTVIAMMLAIAPLIVHNHVYYRTRHDKLFIIYLSFLVYRNGMTFDTPVDLPIASVRPS